MPVKWTAERDQLLLLKILETHELKLDLKKVVAAWPTGEEKPTPRAITERLVRIRANIKGAGGIRNGSADNTSNSNTKLSIASGRKSVTSTPSKQLKALSISTPESGKRKRFGNQGLGVLVKKETDFLGIGDGDNDADGEDEEPATPSKKGCARTLFDIPAHSSSASHYEEGQMDIMPGSSLGLDLAQRSGNDGSIFDADSTTTATTQRRLSRARKATFQYGMVNYGDELDDEESGSGHADDGETSASDYVDEGAGHDDEDFA
ncbi:uncharacterized protein BDV14DRAFT_204847 [Aspergillus stella-maris]|uniref:uncharacterized protein n=1 Tax=Aspergillus stella-maris TaxID=1810926 RepID=UPI003CCCF52B